MIVQVPSVSKIMYSSSRLWLQNPNKSPIGCMHICIYDGELNGEIFVVLSFSSAVDNDDFKPPNSPL